MGDERPPTPSAPISEEMIRDLVKAGHNAMLRIRWIEGLVGIPLLHIHVRIDDYSASMNMDEFAARFRSEMFDRHVQTLIDICLRRPKRDYDPHSCDCLTKSA